ncbi:MAG TPA: hypothetical protein VJM34_12040 [Novosphingobium sp.]|nr:hypothetical protein [Novosphingobium sp.]
MVTSHQAQAGFWVDDADIVTLQEAVPAEVGKAVEGALARSREGVPTPPPSADLSAPLLAAAGVASWNTFIKTAKYVGARQNGEVIKVTPYKNLGSKDGFDPMQDKATLLPSGDTTLGNAVVRALEVAE